MHTALAQQCTKIMRRLAGSTPIAEAASQVLRQHQQYDSGVQPAMTSEAIVGAQQRSWHGRFCTQRAPQPQRRNMPTPTPKAGLRLEGR
jgi:hypothetical protein